MICPKCKCEYREGFTYCRDCNEKLVEEVKAAESDVNNDSNDQISTEEPSLIKVKNAANEFEAWTIIDLLESNGIPCIKREREAGEYLKITMGYSIFGTDILVDKKNYDAAMELIHTLPAGDDNLVSDHDDTVIDNLPDDISTAQEESTETENHTSIRKLPRVFATIWLILIILAFLYMILASRGQLF